MNSVATRQMLAPQAQGWPTANKVFSCLFECSGSLTGPVCYSPLRYVEVSLPLGSRLSLGTAIAKGDILLSAKRRSSSANAGRC